MSGLGGDDDPHLSRDPDRRRRDPLRHRHASRRRGRRRLVALVVALAAAVVAIWFCLSLLQPFHGDGRGAVTVVVPSGASAKQVGDLLAARGVVSSSFFFDLRARIAGKRGDLRAGTFTLSKDMSYAAALDRLTTVPPAPTVIRVTIPEGPSRREVAAIVAAAGIRGDYVAASAQSAALRPRSYGAPNGTRTLEGFLFPATYELRPNQPASVLVAEQLAAFKDAFAGVSLRRAKHKNLTAYDVLTIASMIEREAAIARDRRLIAAVIYNRLHARMALGIDATLRYALDDWTQPLTASQLASDSPFNTRAHPGLPPTPIGNPGLASIRAAANPAHVPYLYYVVKPCGNGAHAFSSTDAQFQRDVDAYNRARAKAGGKSPATC
jgi:peptidoglycan lytic transglycosylase G